MKNVVETIVKSIVDDKDAVIVEETLSGNISIIEIKLRQDDVSKVIGKHGKTAQSIRNIIYAAGYKTKKRYQLDINSLEDN